jgi:hypothetical protein
VVVNSKIEKKTTTAPHCIATLTINKIVGTEIKKKVKIIQGQSGPTFYLFDKVSHLFFIFYLK